MNNCNNCGYCGQCQEKKKCANPCSCAEPVFSIEAMPDDPTTLRFNVNGKSVWYDFEPVIKSGETCTAINVDVVNRLLNYHGECADQTITARELGSILHLADIGDVNADSIEDNGILNYRKDTNCGEGCEGPGDGWQSTNPITVGGDSLDYILGSDEKGVMKSLMPPSDASTFSYLAWRGAQEAGWTKPVEFANYPVDADNKKYVLCLDPSTGQIGYVKESL